MTSKSSIFLDKTVFRGMLETGEHKQMNENERMIKWPTWIKLIRHDVSAYNVLKEKKKGIELYQRFLEAYNRDKTAADTRALAQEVFEKLSLGVSDAKTPLADTEGRRAWEVGKALQKEGDLPDVIFVSPYLRTKLTLKNIVRGWPELNGVKVYEEERIREQDHGLASLYSDWKVFETLHPDQRRLRKLQGPYWYQYPQGENVPDVRDRSRSWTTTLTRDFAGKKVLAVTHHLTILSLRANHERLGEKEFIHLDEHDKPINCGVTVYRCDPNQGQNGRLFLERYNEKLYCD
jgi:probable phosphoglycerate mutase